jgi:hypothetical protein
MRPGPRFPGARKLAAYATTEAAVCQAGREQPSATGSVPLPLGQGSLSLVGGGVGAEGAAVSGR